MSQTPSDPDPEVPSDPSRSSGGGAAEPDSGDQGSFVQRLERRFGKDLDPRIHLQEDESGARSQPATSSERTPSSRSRGLLQKLSDSGSGSGRYQIRSEIARGGMGTIMRVWDEDLRRNLAMKVMLGGPAKGSSEAKRSSADEERLGRFLEEAQITGQLDHPGVVPVHELGIDDEGRVFFTMRLVRGRELKEVLDLTREGREGWTLTRSLGLFLKICETMAFAHSKGVVHRDLKPANVMVGRFGEVYVMDWGLARVLGRDDTKDIRLKPAEDSHMSLVRTTRREESDSNPDSPLVTMDGDVVGTPSFMSPEQARGVIADVGPRSDVYSLGAILYYLLTGRTPYVGKDEKVSAHVVLGRLLEGPPDPVAKAADESLPPELFAICDKAMARGLDQRYASMLELADDIQAFLENRVVRAHEVGAVAEFKKWCIRNRGMAAAIAGLLLLALVSAVGFVVQKDRQVAAMQEQRNEVEAARSEALDNLKRAQESERQAQEHLQLANQKKEEADLSAERAQRNEKLARHSSYRANVLAADYSLRLRDVVEARRLLEQTSADLRGWEYRHLDLRAHEAMRTFRPGDQWVDAASWGPDGSWIVAITRRGELVQFDVESGNRLALLESRVYRFNLGTAGQVEISMDVSRDGTRAVFTGNERELRLYDLVQGRSLGTLPRPGEPGHEKLATAAAFSPNLRHIASGSQVGEVLVWDAEEGTIVQRFGGQSQEITSIAWSSDSRRFATASRDATIRILEVESGRVLQVLRGHQGAVTDLDWQPFGDVLASASADGTVIVWDAASGDLTRTLTGHEGEVLAVALHPSELRLGSAGADRTIRLWDFGGEGEVPAPEVLLGHADSVLDLEYRRDGRRLLSAAADQLVKTWDALGSVGITTLPRDRGLGGTAASFSPSGDLLATTESDQTVTLWDAWSLEPRAVLRGHDRFVQTLDFSPDGRTVLTGAGDKEAILWEVATGNELRRFSGNSARIAALEFGPDGSWFASTWGRSTVRVWDVASGDALRDLRGHDGWIRRLAVSPDGRWIAATGLTGDISLWGPDSDEPEDVIPGHDGGRGASGLVFTQDGSRLVSCGSTTLRIWNIPHGDPELIVDHEEQATCVDLFPDESRIVTGAVDGVLRVWDAVTGELLVKLTVEDAGPFGISSVHFGGDGQRLLASTVEVARIWETDDAARRLESRYQAEVRRSKVQPLVDDLFARHFFLEDVLLRIRADEALSDEARTTALALARVRGDDPWSLDATSLDVLTDRTAGEEAYELSQRRALAAFSLQRDAPALRATLGIAHYRVGDLAESLATLEAAWEAQVMARAERRSFALTREQEVLLLSYLALALFESGDEDQARSRLDDARRRYVELEPDAGPHATAAMREAEDGIEPGS